MNVPNWATLLSFTLAKEDVEEVEEKKVYTLKKEEEGFNVRIENGVYIVDGPAIEKILRRANLEDNESLYYFQKSIRFLGVEDRLKQMGIKEGDTVKFMDWPNYLRDLIEYEEKI